MCFLLLEMDRAVLDFNFCELLDPTLKPGNGPAHAELFELIYKARQGDRFTPSEFANTMYWTLREATFECFQQIHGPRPILYRDWFYCKLSQLLEILVYQRLSVASLEEPQSDRPWEEGFLVLGSTGPAVQPEDIEQAFLPEDNESYPWFELTSTVCAATGNRLEVLEEILARRRKERRSSRAGVWRKNEKRNRIICHLLEDGRDGREICEALDERVIPPLPILQENNIRRWVTGWDDERLQRNIQQLFSKLRKRQKGVKS
jgi:hypothetical protein